MVKREISPITVAVIITRVLLRRPLTLSPRIFLLFAIKRIINTPAKKDHPLIIFMLLLVNLELVSTDMKINNNKAVN